MSRPIAVLLLALLFLAAPQAAVAAEARKAVLVTGASTGIGRNIAETLAAKGYLVYAGARKPEDLAALNKIDNVVAIRLDVTVQSEIDAAVANIRKRGTGLHGLVNNAGVAVVGPLIEVDETDMQFQMDVNLYGPYRVTKAFAPLLIEDKGRIITIGSISGTLSAPFLGPYSMSKHAVEAYTDTLAAEMEKFGVEVSVIEPGNFNSEIFAAMRKRMEQRGKTLQGSLYQAELEERLLKRPMDRSQYPEPDAVSAAVIHALFDPAPRRRYMVVPNQREAEVTIRKAIEELVQLNQDQPYSYDREGLVRMLDEALAATAASKP